MPAKVIYQCTAVQCCMDFLSANKPYLLLASLKAGIFVPSFHLLFNWHEWVPLHSQWRHIMGNSVSLECLNCTLEFSVGTDAKDSAIEKAEWIEEISQQFSISRSSIFMLIQQVWEMRNYKWDILETKILALYLFQWPFYSDCCSVWKMRVSKPEHFKHVLYVHNYFVLTNKRGSN